MRVIIPAIFIMAFWGVWGNHHGPKDTEVDSRRPSIALSDSLLKYVVFNEANIAIVNASLTVQVVKSGRTKRFSLAMDILKKLEIRIP